MNIEEFDHITKIKLQDYTAAIPAGLWEKIHVPSINPPIEEFDQFVKQKLFDHSAPVSPEVWNKIKPKEDEDKKVFFLLPRAGMVAASILLLILTGSVSAYLYYQKMALPVTNETNPTNNTFNSAPTNNNNRNKNDEKSNNVILNNTDATRNNNNENDASNLKDELVIDLNSTSSINTKPNKTNPNGSINNNANSYNNQNPITNQSLAFTGIQQKSEGLKKNTLIDGVENNKIEPTIDYEYTAANKLDASLIGFSKNRLSFNSKEKKVSAFNHTSNIKNVVICPSDRKLRNTDWDLEIYASPNYAFKSVTNTTASQAYINRKDSSERSQISFTAGFRIVKPINDRFSLKTGLEYSQINENFTYRSENEIKTTTVVTVRTITLANGNTVTVSDTSVVQQIGFKNNTIKNRYKSFDIPALVSYQFGNDDLRIGINAGVIFNVSSWYQGVFLDTTLNAQPLTKETNMSYKNNIGMGIYTGISITKRLNYNTSIFAEPFLRYNLSDMTTPQSSFKQRFSVGGLSIGLRLNLNNR
jgi:hypothetical protein